jgi:spoIIIJ-associated protein
MNGIRKTAPTVSQAVRDFMTENSVSLESLSANLVGEKIFTDKREYTVECFKKNPVSTWVQPETSDADIEFARDIVAKLLALMRFIGAAISVKKEAETVILKVSTPGKDGLLIGKNGQNIMAMQYILTIAMDKNLRRHAPIIIDIDSYRDKRAAYLRSTVKTMAEKVLMEPSETITDFLPSYERKLLHEEIKSFDGLKTFSVGKGSYKKVVITSLL